MPKEEALQTVHGYVEKRAWRLKGILLKLMRIPGFYKKVPGIFAKQTPKLFGTAAGFAATEIQVTGGVWRIDMTRCPYHDTCVQYGCPELCSQQPRLIFSCADNRCPWRNCRLRAWNS